MVALALKETGNLGLLKPWILGLREPFDKNNQGETEADNPGRGSSSFRSSPDLLWRHTTVSQSWLAEKLHLNAAGVEEPASFACCTAGVSKVRRA